MTWRRPIIQSRLQDDFYNFTQGQFAFHRHPDVPVKFALVNRTKNVGLAYFINRNELEHELDYFRNLPFRDDEIEFLAGLTHLSNGQKVFKDDYLVYYDWFEEYGTDLAMLLPDTYTTDFCFNRVITKELAERYRGARHDSGDPNAFIDKFVKMYREFDIDFSQKLMFASDGLDEIEIPRIGNYAKERRLPSSFGWGSNLTNDLGNAELGIWAPKNLSLVVKAIEANGRKLVKLSDNPEKMIGDREEIEWLKKEIGYKEMPKIAVTY